MAHIGHKTTNMPSIDYSLCQSLSPKFTITLDELWQMKQRTRRKWIDFLEMLPFNVTWVRYFCQSHCLFLVRQTQTIVKICSRFNWELTRLFFFRSIRMPSIDVHGEHKFFWEFSQPIFCFSILERKHFECLYKIINGMAQNHYNIIARTAFG